VKLTLTG